MKIKGLKNKRYVGLTVIAFFIVWMIFFDANSYLYQLEHNKEIEKLEKAIEFYKVEIKKNRETLNNLSIQKNINNFAREKYNYKKENEVLYIIEYDTID